ncbi:MAG TPA: hypothetical protein PLF27_00775 [Sedimentibacter sp.]|nr:hypothetical protein [Sedimentibacter sp.]
MLLDYIIDFCDREYRDSDTGFVCDECNHPIKCSGGCEKCLDEIHFPDSYDNGKLEYDCINILNYYVCKYSNKYCSEIEYALEQSEIIKSFNEFNVMSIGCGHSPDLMALEFYRDKHNLKIPIDYIGYDNNRLWEDIHNEIKKHGKKNNIEVSFEYEDVIQYFNEYYVAGINMIFMQYIISYFYNTNQIDEIDCFFEDLIDVVKRKREKLIIIINDVNSCYRGRDYFLNFYNIIRNNNLHGRIIQRYFDYKIKSRYQRYGTAYYSHKILHNINDELRERYNSAVNCSSAQLIIEVD